MKKILISLMTLVLVVGMAGAGAFAYFSDTETSTGNTFTAGTLDLLVITTGACSDAGKITVNEQGDGFNDSVVFANLAPGDSGSITWTLTNTGSLPGTVDIRRQLVNDFDNVNTEPEMAIEGAITATTPGELDNNMWLTSTCTINGQTTFPGPPWNGTYVGLMSDEILYTDHIDLLPQPLPVGGVLVLTYNWSIDSGVGNIIQGDTFTLDLQMYLDQ